MSRRILTIGAAVLLAVLGAIGVLDYVHQADQRALAGVQAVTVYTATAQIASGTPAGTAVKDGLLVSQRFPASSVPADAVRSITPGMSGLVLTSGLASGQMLLSPMLGAAVQTAAALPIPPGMVAVTMQFCVQQAVANYVTPGSKVDIFNTFVSGKIATGACSGISPGAGGVQPNTRLVLANVLVLAVGEGTATSPSSNPAVAADGPPAGSAPATPSTIYLTMAVAQADAERLIELQESGSPYLALVTSASGTSADAVFQP